jgi:hypothetical protein
MKTRDAISAKNNCLRTFIDVDVNGDSEHEHAVMTDRAATAGEVATAVANLPDLEQIQANLPPPEAHGSSCNTGSSCGSHSSQFKAKAEPLIQIQIAPGSSKVIELPKPVEFQPRKTKVPLHGRAKADHRHLRKRDGRRSR